MTGVVGEGMGVLLYLFSGGICLQAGVRRACTKDEWPGGVPTIAGKIFSGA
jgi:hypothetical protein